MGTLQSHVKDHELQIFKIYHLNVVKSDINLPCTHPGAKFVCSPAEVDMHS